MRLQCSLTHFGPHLPYGLVYKEGWKCFAKQQITSSCSAVFTSDILVLLLLTPSLRKYAVLSPFFYSQLTYIYLSVVFFKPITNISLGPSFLCLCSVDGSRYPVFTTAIYGSCRWLTSISGRANYPHKVRHDNPSH